VIALRRYPVKSMQAESLQRADLHWTGLHGDRRYAFIKAANTSGFPYLTGRDMPELVLHRARYAEPADLKRSRVQVTGPDGAEYDLWDPELAQQLGDAAGGTVRLMQVERGLFDAMPVSLLTTHTAASIEAAHGAPVGLDRFRANIVVRPAVPGMTERDWLGGTVTFGDDPAAPGLRLDLEIPRCAMVAIDPVTAAKDAAILRTVVQRFGNRVGAYCAVTAPGGIRVGDRVRLVDHGSASTAA